MTGENTRFPIIYLYILWETAGSPLNAPSFEIFMFVYELPNCWLNKATPFLISLFSTILQTFYRTFEILYRALFAMSNTCSSVSQSIFVRDDLMAFHHNLCLHYYIFSES